MCRRSTIGSEAVGVFDLKMDRDLNLLNRLRPVPGWIQRRNEREMIEEAGFRLRHNRRRLAAQQQRAALAELEAARRRTQARLRAAQQQRDEHMARHRARALHERMQRNRPDARYRVPGWVVEQMNRNAWQPPPRNPWDLRYADMVAMEDEMRRVQF